MYVIDSLPIAGSNKDRIPRLKTHQRDDARGCIPNKKRYFYGLGIHLLVTEPGEPVEFFLALGAFSDTSALQLYQ
jgi:hypothetical protein